MKLRHKTYPIYWFLRLASDFMRRWKSRSRGCGTDTPVPVGNKTEFAEGKYRHAPTLSETESSGIVASRQFEGVY